MKKKYKKYVKILIFVIVAICAMYDTNFIGELKGTVKEVHKELEIIQNSLEIFPIIWQYILVDVPLRVLHPDAKEESLEGDGWRLITEDDKKEVIDPRLAKLKDFIKE